MKPRNILAFTVGLLLMGPVSDPAWAEEGIERFFGSYAGSGTAERADGSRETRELSMTLERYKDDGFKIDWTTVARDGKEDVDTVVDEFLPVEGSPGVYILAPTEVFFGKDKLPNPLEGEPMRWASIKDDTLTVYSLGITEDGGSEMQIFRRTLTEEGMDITFVGLDDGEVQVRASGTLTRTN